MTCIDYGVEEVVVSSIFDGVHLTEAGINILASNIVNYLHEIVLGVNVS